MCIGDTQDSLNAAEQAFIRQKAAAALPAHDLALRRNEDGMTWAVLTPQDQSLLPKITICRVDPCIMVMLEDRHARRQFRALADVENAMDFVHAISNPATHAFEAPTLH